MINYSSQQIQLRSVAEAFALSLLVALSTAGGVLAQNSSDKMQLKLDQIKTVKTPIVRRKAPPASSEDILLVMPNAGADKDETMDALKEAHGTVIGTIGEGSLTTLIIKTEKGKLAETEKRLSGDKHFAAIQRDIIAEDFRVTTAAVPNDPYLGWELPAVGVTPRGWTQHRGAGVVIAIADSGCASANPDLLGKTYAGYDAVNNREGNANIDVDIATSHGTACATSAAARTNNVRLSAAPAGDAFIYPIKIASPSGGRVYATTQAIIRAVYQAGSRGIRIINISYGSNDARYSFANATTNSVLHQYLRWYHDQRNGLAFFAAGNEDQFDPNPRSAYLIMVTALNSRYGITSFSNWGNPVWFTAPGEDITCSNRDGRAVRMNGTSFASPMVAGIAAAIISKNPNLTNRQVESILIRSCGQGGRWLNTSYGYGLPNLERALSLF